jgi:hypothetical protein
MEPMVEKPSPNRPVRLRMRAGIGRLRKPFLFSAGPLAAAEVPWPFGVLSIDKDGEITLRPPLFLRLVLPTARLSISEVVRVDSWSICRHTDCKVSEYC